MFCSKFPGVQAKAGWGHRPMLTLNTPLPIAAYAENVHVTLLHAHHGICKDRATSSVSVGIDLKKLGVRYQNV